MDLTKHLTLAQKSFLLLIFLFQSTFGLSQSIVTSDIDLFWEAYDKIRSTSDSALQVKYFKELYLDKGSPGLDGAMRARNYTVDEFLGAINNYPKFWDSVRENTYKAKGMAKELEVAAEKLKVVYPDLKPADVYFTIGALRMNGTGIDGMLLIGTELAFADSNTVSSEFPEYLGHLPDYFKGNPIDNVIPLNVHEYVHTQQIVTRGYNLLAQCVFEGVAEFIPVIALNKASKTPSIAFGKANEDWIRNRFKEVMFSPFFYQWLWNAKDNEFKMGDVGYYVGYEMVERYYKQAEDKAAVIKELIEMDYQDPEVVEAFVDKTGYLTESVAFLRQAYEEKRPRIVGIKEIENGAQDVDPNLKKLTFEFSRPMNTYFKSTDFGPLGKAHCPTILDAQTAEDGMTVTYELDLEPGKLYQFVLERGFRTDDAIPLKPYLVEFRTK